MTLKVGIVAGEPSGDRLGADLLRALKRETEVTSVGIGGSELCAEGLRSLVSLEELTMHGFAEPLRRLPFLWQTLKRVEEQVLDEQADVFVGVDFNVFNLLLEGRLKRRGVPVVHYVSPSVYAWRRGRTRRVARSADVLLTLFPFEPPLYAGEPLRAVFVGHPLADQIQRSDVRPQTSDDASSDLTGQRSISATLTARAEARASLGLAGSDAVVTLMPGSRMSEIRMMLPAFLRASVLLRAQMGHPSSVKFLLPCVTNEVELSIKNALQNPDFKALDIRLERDRSRELLAASDAALIKSGTSTLEAMLLGVPMVVAYRLPEITYRIVKPMLRSRYVALPNILAGEALVPELLQDEMQPAALAQALLAQLNEDHTLHVRRRFLEIHGQLQQGASANAAREVLTLANQRKRSAK